MGLRSECAVCFTLRMETKTLAAISMIGALLIASGWWLLSAGAGAEANAEPIVTVVDRSGGWTELQPIVDGFSRSPHIDLQVATECPDGGYCVVIQEPVWRKTADWMGWWEPVSNNVSQVLLNASDARNTDQQARAWILCHELSHALMGAADKVPDTEQPACMVDDPTGPASPTARDLQLLDRIHDAGTAEDGTALAYNTTEGD